MKKIVGPILLVLLVIGVVAALVFSIQEQSAAKKIVTIRGLVGSEKEAFFKDPRVVAALRKAQLEVIVEKAGSREIADKIKTGAYDFASPSGVSSAEMLQRDPNIGVISSHEIFFTPMAIASWQQIATVLETNGLATTQGSHTMVDMEAFLAAFDKEVIWSNFQQNTSYNVNKRVLIASTDIRTSNSATMYLAIVSYIANNNNIVQSFASIDTATKQLLSDLFLAQGFQAGSSAVPFNDYMTMGMGKAPLVMIYESQYIFQAATGGLKPDMVLLYPEPTLFTKHFILALNEDADRLGKILRNDPELQQDPVLHEAAVELQKLAIEHGFRNTNTDYFNEFTEQHNVSVAQNLVHVIEPPSYEVLEAMTQYIEQQY